MNWLGRTPMEAQGAVPPPACQTGRAECRWVGREDPERVSGSLADVLTDGSGGEQVLQQLEQANAFVVSLDAGRSWFRSHHQFTDLLRLEPPSRARVNGAEVCAADSRYAGRVARDQVPAPVRGCQA
jgi:hypothetical protein